MVEIKMSGMCEGCKYPHLYLNHAEEDTYADGVIHTYSIECKHEPACMRAAAIGRQMKEEYENIQKVMPEPIQEEYNEWE